MHLKISFYLVFAILLVYCDVAFEDPNNQLVAKTEKSELLAEDLSKLIGPFHGELDSIKKAQEAINRWARDEILFEQAQNILNHHQTTELDKTIDQYKRDLYISKYKNMVIQSRLNSYVTNQEKKIYYDQDLSSLALDQMLIKFRYISFEINHPKEQEFVQKFNQFNTEDRRVLDSLTFLNFSHAHFNDSIWFERNQFLSKVMIVNQQNINQFQTPNKLYRVTKSNLIHLLYLSDIALPGEKPPIDYLDNLLERLIINKRIQELEREFDNDIINQAIQSDILQIY
ncbi:MAG: hypothetical protein OXC61_02870 [Flavobacteriaceae bacterium]|nr:hypothetical protein [Flavobacteriaceae bacterium]